MSKISCTPSFLPTLTHALVHSFEKNHLGSYSLAGAMQGTDDKEKNRGAALKLFPIW